MHLRIREREIAAHEQEYTHHCHPRELRRRVENLASAEATKRKHTDSGDHEPYAAHQGGRNMLDGDVDAEIGRPPKEIHQREGKDHGEAMLALELRHGECTRTKG